MTPAQQGLAEATGAQWPLDFEQATLAHLKDALGLEISG